MANNCFDSKLRSYNGTSQPQRTLDALLTNAAKVDERETDDLILFTKRYGAYLNYYDLTNSIAGDWQGLMGKDVAVTIASVADWDIKDYTTFVKYLNDKIINAGNDTDAKDFFKLLFDFVFSLASAMDSAYRQLPVDVDYYPFLTVSATSKLSSPLKVLTQYYQQFVAALLIDESSVLVDPLMPVEQPVFSQNFDITKLSAPFIASPPVTAFTITLSGGIHDDINHILTHNLFNGALQSFIDGVVNIVNRTPDYLAKTLSKYPSHAPHYALYLTFIKLFAFAQQHLNGYTQKHLDFYYKQILQLKNNIAEPDYVHLIFQLRKNINQHFLTQGTLFKAGKDADNNDLFYALTDNALVQTAQVQALKSLYLAKDDPIVTLYASPVASSADGQGAKITSADNSWYPFKSPVNTNPASIGFAIASNVLYLNEGKRTITLAFTCDNLNGIINTDLKGIFDIQLTGVKKWYPVAGYTPNVTGSNSFSLQFILLGDAPAIVPYSSKIHGGNFVQALPTVQVTLADYTLYQKIKVPRITSVNITVEVDQVKNLSLQNDNGKLNPAKAFKPFGDFPEAGASFIIGSKEIFQKSLRGLTLNYAWQTAPVADVSVGVDTLVKGNWQPVVAINTPISIDAGLINSKDILYSGIVQSPADFTPDADYAVTAIDGFIRLNLSGTSFNLNTFQNAITLPSVSVSTSTPPVYTVMKGTTPPLPHPVLTSVSLGYTAVDNIIFSSANFDARSNFFYHLEPFGFREMHPLIITDGLTLLPVFNLDDNSTIQYHDGGELWVGLNNAQAGETIAILFEVSDGTANPLKNETTVNWFYLRANNWLPFTQQGVSDQTQDLTISGLVTVSIPADATTDNTRADTGLIWVKAVVQHDTDAVCNLIAVDTNAAKAQFVQDIPDSIVFTKALAPNIISKPAVADGALKSTQQPYPSFDGRVTETDSQFYQRVSERLRHKHRAITPWDYERLTLQYYPQIFKAKCISHTGFVTDEKTGTPKYTEMLPGHVMVITIPDLSGLTAANLLRPYTSAGLLIEIQAYLQTLTSPFVQVKACNPQFEEIQFDFEVAFYEEKYAEVFVKQLSLDIEQFLTPWAYGNPQSIQFGNTIEKSVVLNFVEERPYVDFVTCFKMNQIISRNLPPLSNIETAVASTARSILVSYYDPTATYPRHIINSTVTCDCNG